LWKRSLPPARWERPVKILGTNLTGATSDLEQNFEQNFHELKSNHVFLAGTVAAHSEDLQTALNPQFIPSLEADLQKRMDEKCETTKQAAKKAVADGVAFYNSTLRSDVAALESKLAELRLSVEDLAVASATGSKEAKAVVNSLAKAAEKRRAELLPKEAVAAPVVVSKVDPPKRPLAKL
jgi:hypothetical protein